MINLLQETLECLQENGKSPKDVLWVGSSDGGCAISWGNFSKIADFEYDNEYGCREIVSDLVIVGDNWWLERGEFAGAEWWDFKTTPHKQPSAKQFYKVYPASWDKLAEIQNEPDQTA